MTWYEKSTLEKGSKPIKDDIWVRCKSCNSYTMKEKWQQNLSVCPSCNYHDRITARKRISIIIDDGTFQETNSTIHPSDPLGFVYHQGKYSEKTKSTIKATNEKESVVTGTGEIHGIPVSIAVMDFRFLGGSLGCGTGEKILQGANLAYDRNIPYIVFSASGGASMQEGMLSLMQMAKTCAGIARLDNKRLPFISVLTDPTLGGVSASFAMVGDLNLAEPGAVIGFSGKRVIEQTIKQKLPNDFQTAEFTLAHGFIDRIVERKKMKDVLAQLLRYYTRK